MVPHVPLARPETHPNAEIIKRLLAEAKPTRATIARVANAIGRLSGCPCGCSGDGDPDCVTRRPVGRPIDYSQQCEAGPLGWPVSA